MFNMKNFIKARDTVSLESISNGGKMKVFIEPTTISYKYLSAGGPYDSPEMQKMEHSNAGDMLDDGTLIISTESILGKALLGKGVGDHIKYVGPTGLRFEYRIATIH